MKDLISKEIIVTNVMIIENLYLTKVPSLGTIVLNIPIKNNSEIAINYWSILCTNKEDIIVNNNIYKNCVYSNLKPNYRKFIVNLQKCNKEFYLHVHNIKNEKRMDFNIIHYRHCWVNQRCIYQNNMKKV